MRVPIEVVTKENEIAIYIDKAEFFNWLKSEGDVPWDGDPNSGSPEEREKKAEEQGEGYKTGDGTTKEFPNPVEDKTVQKPDPNGEEVDGSHVADRDIGEEPDSINLFDEGPNGIGGVLQDDTKGKEKIKALRDWLKAEKFNYKNFCIYLYQLKEVAGFKLSTPLIGLTQKKEPTIFQLATRFHSYWLSSKDYIAGDYKTFLIAQLADMGITIQMVKDEFDGEEIDPKNLPKGIEVSA